MSMELFYLAIAAVAAAAPAVAVTAGMVFRRRTINELALENAQVAALINQTNMAASVNANMMDAQADKVQEAA